MPFGVSFTELVIILVVAVVLFGSRLPEVARNLGASYQQFRKGLHDIQSSIKADLDAESRDLKHVVYRDYNDDYDAPPAKFTPPQEE
jgi:sec-independent protein translocase protein TatA